MLLRQDKRNTKYLKYSRKKGKIYKYLHISLNILGFPGGSVGKPSTCSVGDTGSIPGLGRSSGEGQTRRIPWT